MHLSLFPLSNDLFLFTLCALILYHVYTEFINPKPRSFSKKKKYSKIPLKARPLLFPPVYYGSISQTLLHLDINAINKSTPPNIILTDENATEKTENRVKIVRKRESVSISPQRRPSSKVENSPQTENLDLEICARITYPFMPGCEPTGEHANSLAHKFPQLSRPDIVRFLVARKGNVRASEEMIEKYLSWRNIHFPLKKKDIRAALMTKCFFPYGVSKDGSPVVYMRGGLYDVNKASPEEFVMAAAYTIDWSLAQYPEQVNVTVLVHTVNIPGGPNQGADTNFIKLFIQVILINNTINNYDLF